ncbi:hypothetical protein [Paraconexibacter sp.]|uniref:hypothetical protein n=1 Tax=Paraconexibacter sp. TaxID=2949640 RepID=UPI003567821D
MRIPSLVLSLSVIALALGACGDDAPATPDADASLVFSTSGLAVAEPASAATSGTLRFPAGTDLTITVASQDGRPHGLTLEGAPRRARVVLRPGERKPLKLGVLAAGTYRLAPDGAGDPVPLVIAP